MFSNDRNALRKLYFDTWRAHQDQQPITPLQDQILQVMLDHPEYHRLLSHPERYQDKDYLPEFGESNPFLHMGLHLAIREQVATDRPAGIRTLFQQRLQKHPALDVEHQMIEVLAEILWQSQRDDQPPDEKAYLARLQKISK